MNEQEKKNFYTHHWSTCDGVDYNCSVCDCKPHHKVAKLPCVAVETINVNESWENEDDKAQR